MLFTEFYGLKDGKSFLSWIRGFDQLPEDVLDRLYFRTSEVTKAVVEGHLGVALVQAVLLGASFSLVGLPNILFWSFVMALLGLIPIIGTALIWIPAVAYLFLTNSALAAGALLLWSLLVTSFTDDVLRPYLVDGAADIHPFLVIIGVIGGLHVFGAIGIFIGPIILGVTKTLLEIYREE